MKRAPFVVSVASKTNAIPSFEETLQRHFEERHGRDASQTGMGRKTGFSGLGLHGMRMGVQPFRASGWHIHGRNEGPLLPSARQTGRASCLRPHPQGQKKSPRWK